MILIAKAFKIQSNGSFCTYSNLPLDFLEDHLRLLNNPVSEQILTNDMVIAMQATLKSTLGCAVSFSSTDLRPDMKTINVPTLVIHGDDDQTVPIKATGKQAAQMISGAKYIVYEGEPHGLFYTSKDRLNTDLIEFLR